MEQEEERDPPKMDVGDNHHGQTKIEESLDVEKPVKTLNLETLSAASYGNRVLREKDLHQ